MRENKFRQPIWKRGVFGGWHYWGFITDGNFSSPNTGSSSIAKAKEESQKYTGLKDKNGKEIYEGDIVEKWCHCRGLDPRNRGIENSSGYYKSLTTTVKWSEQGLNYNIYPHHDDAYWLVIGNIYESPELLEGK